MERIKITAGRERGKISHGSTVDVQKKRERETAKPPANVHAALFSNGIWRCLNVIKMCAGWGQIRLRPKKNPGETVLGMLFLLNEWEKGRWVRRRRRWKRGKGERENEGWRLWQQFSVRVCAWLVPRKTRPEQGWESDFSWELQQETPLLQGEGCRSTAMAHSQNLLSQNTSTSSSFKSLYVSPSFPFSPGQDHSPSTGLCIFSDFPCLGFRPKKLCLWGITFHTCACLQGWRAMKTRSHMSREGRVG